MQASVSMADAPAFIRLRAHELRDARTSQPAAPIVVAITGPVGSGKSFLASLLTACVLSWDDYLPNYDAVPEQHRDSPLLADHARLCEDLASLKAGRVTITPAWSFHSHARSGTRTLTPAPIVACEGIHALHPLLAHLVDIRVFVSATPTTRWARWEHLEQTGVRGWGVKYAHHFFHTVADPTFAAFAPDYLTCADVVVANELWRPQPLTPTP